MSNLDQRSRPLVGFALAFVEVSDGKALRNFYGTVLGLDVRKEFGVEWTEYGTTDGANIAVHQVDDKEPDAPPQLFLSFHVTDISQLRNTLIASGAACSEIRARDRGRYFTACDPAGTRLHFIEFDSQWLAQTSY